MLIDCIFVLLDLLHGSHATSNPSANLSFTGRSQNISVIREINGRWAQVHGLRKKYSEKFRVFPRANLGALDPWL
jgi:hypothetical protein